MPTVVEVFGGIATLETEHLCVYLVKLHRVQGRTLEKSIEVEVLPGRFHIETIVNQRAAGPE